MTFLGLSEAFSFYNEYWNGSCFLKGRPSLDGYHHFIDIVVEEKFLWIFKNERWMFRINPETKEGYSSLLFENKFSENTFFFIPDDKKTTPFYLYLNIYTNHPNA